MNSEDRRPVLIIDKSIIRNSLGSEALAKNFQLIESNSDEDDDFKFDDDLKEFDLFNDSDFDDQEDDF